ncbi:transcription termination/antitermination protein NusG [Corynebacterium hadale]|uniref:transcription termination/antitermination protein NusG n=1 Tax=Corynebacterium hadale TaxID=2026255 RepID=UPI001EF3274C|nr:transcription termination/antitermination protein NusG [Corynebacterium hadale]MCG7255352.1 transcription termination/antitermination protein NusG [Corynebacterium hadale]MCG7256709.1 transcription termination/antitermination protein NusG [Corynebacterium hadale]MCG7265335.1 transcription termination/antitermination protein NusG [Corynebacterium hadale]
MAVENNDALNTVEENELEMIDEGAPVTDQTDPEEELAEQQADSAEPEAPSEQEEELEMVDEGAPVTEETDPETEGTEGAEATEDAETTEGDAEAAAAAALGDDSAAEADSEYRARLRAYVRELKKLPGEWYIIQSYSGYENKVKTNLEMRIQTLEVEDSIYDVVVPIEQVLEKKDDKRKLVKRKLLPGYVLVRMEMNDAAWSVVRETPGVTSFVGNEGNATPVKHRDVAKFLMPKAEPVEGKSVANAEGETVIAMPEEEEKPKVTHDYKVGEAVTILSGAFASVAGTISEIDEETGKIQALVSIFGRETPVELTADQIERIM